MFYFEKYMSLMHGVGFQMMSLIMVLVGKSQINHDRTISNIWTCLGILPRSTGQPALLTSFTSLGNQKEGRQGKHQDCKKDINEYGRYQDNNSSQLLIQKVGFKRQIIFQMKKLPKKQFAKGHETQRCHSEDSDLPFCCFS